MAITKIKYYVFERNEFKEDLGFDFFKSAIPSQIEGMADYVGTNVPSSLIFNTDTLKRILEDLNSDNEDTEELMHLIDFLDNLECAYFLIPGGSI